MDQTAKKYLEVLQDMYVRESFSSTEICREYKINSALPVVTLHLGLTEKIEYSQRYKWIGAEPTEKTVEKLRQEISKRFRKLKKNYKTSQGSIEITSSVTTEQEAIDILKNSKNYTYEIYRYTKEKL